MFGFSAQKVFEVANVVLFLFGGQERERILLCSLGWPQTHYVAQTNLNLAILLPQPPHSFWDYRYASSHAHKIRYCCFAQAGMELPSQATE